MASANTLKLQGKDPETGREKKPVLRFVRFGNPKERIRKEKRTPARGAFGGTR